MIISHISMNNPNVKKYLTEAIALHARAEELERYMQFNKVFQKDLSASKLVEKLSQAENISKLYAKALRMFSVLRDNIDKGQDPNLNYLVHKAEVSVSRMKEVLRVLNKKAEKWGLAEDEQEESPDTERDPFADMNQANDDLLAETQQDLKTLSNLLNYMNPNTIRQVSKEIKKMLE